MGLHQAVLKKDSRTRTDRRRDRGVILVDKLLKSSGGRGEKIGVLSGNDAAGLMDAEALWLLRKNLLVRILLKSSEKCMYLGSSLVSIYSRNFEHLREETDGKRNG